MFDRWFLNDGIPLELCLDYHHDKWLVVLSYLVAAFASYTAFHLIDRVRSTRTPGIRTLWLAIAGTSMGCGIFAMHFIAMLAVRIPVPVQYDVGITTLSVLFAVGASAFAFHLVSRDARDSMHLSAGAVILGGGIGLMHYTGMAALRMPAHIYYDPLLFGLSILVAVFLSFLALTVLRWGTARRRFSELRTCVAGALVMGLAVTAMHYTAMLATWFYPEAGPNETGTALDGTLMALAVGAATLLISSIAAGAALLDHRAEAAEAMRARSESFLQSVIDNSADGILSFDETMVIRACNPAASWIFGRDISGIVGRRFDDLIEGSITGALTEGAEVRRGETTCRGTDGESRIIDYTVSEMRFAGERLFTCLVRDVTARRHAEQALRASEERFRNLVVNVPGVVYQRRLDSDGRVSFSYVSDRIRELTGLDANAVMADYSRLFDTVHPDDRDRLRQSLARSAAELSPWDEMFRITTLSGEQKWLRTISQPRRMPDGEVLWDGLFLDVTASVQQAEDRKALERKLRQAQKMDSLGTLAGGIAHELNNILVPISGLTELVLLDLPTESPARKSLETILANARRAGRIVERILSFSRQEEIQRVAVPLLDIVREAVELLELTQPATISIRTELDPSVGRILADGTQIHQILMNLASNARHAMEGKVGELKIEVGQEIFEEPFQGRDGTLPAGDYARLSVVDDGHGMDEPTIERIFEPFFTTKGVGRGTGLGLSVIHGIVKAHGGAIEVASTPGVGTRVDVYLPRLVDEAPVEAAEAKVVNA